MTVTLDMPEPLAQQLQARWGSEALSRRILEAFAVEGYRQEFLTRHQVGELLGLSLWETEAFLKAHDALLHYDLDDLEADRQAHDRVLP